MYVKVVPVGDALGITLPRSLITELNIKDELRLERQDDAIVLTPVHEKPRRNWKAAFAAMHEAGDDELLVPAVFEDEIFEETVKG